MQNEEQNKIERPKLAVDDYAVRRTDYENAISCKFDNRRVTIIKLENGFGFEFLAIDHDYKPHALCKYVREKVAVTRINVSKESAEIIMLNLAELMGFRVVR